MLDYRLYFIDAQSGHIKSCREFAAEDDIRAIQDSERCRDGGPMELWRGTHKVEHWPAIASRSKALT